MLSPVCPSYQTQAHGVVDHKGMIAKGGSDVESPNSACNPQGKRRSHSKLAAFFALVKENSAKNLLTPRRATDKTKTHDRMLMSTG